MGVPVGGNGGDWRVRVRVCWGWGGTTIDSLTMSFAWLACCAGGGCVARVLLWDEALGGGEEGGEMGGGKR